MFERTVLRIGAVSFVAGLTAVVVFELLHPSRQDPNNNPLVFTEYAHADAWGHGAPRRAPLLKRAVDAWVAALPDGRTAAFAAA